MAKSTVSLHPELHTALPGPISAGIVAADRKIISSSYTRTYPLVARKGEGMYIEDADGNRFLDFTAGIAVCSTGHCHREVVAAIQRQAAELIHMSGTDFYYEQMVGVGALISAGAPMPGPHRIFYSNSGAEAIEAGLKLARYHTRRPNFVGFYNCFHGRTLGALSMTSSKAVQRERFAPLLPGFFHVTYPDPYRPPHGAADVTAACLEELERLFHTTTPADEVAAVLFEPVQGEGGYVVPPPEFVRELRRICDREGILLIADEVQSGAGRTGKMWAIEHFGVAPDIVCSAKGIASGLPLGVTFARAGIMDWTAGAHASTFGGNPICLAAAEATIRLLNHSLIRNAAEVGGQLLQRLKNWPQRFACVGEVRGLGLMIGIEIVSDRTARTPDPARRDRMVEAAFERGLLILGCGASTIRLMPPLICTNEHAEVAAAILEDVLAEVN